MDGVGKVIDRQFSHTTRGNVLLLLFFFIIFTPSRPAINVQIFTNIHFIHAHPPPPLIYTWFYLLLFNMFFSHFPLLTCSLAHILLFLYLVSLTSFSSQSSFFFFFSYLPSLSLLPLPAPFSPLLSPLRILLFICLLFFFQLFLPPFLFFLLSYFFFFFLPASFFYSASSYPFFLIFFLLFVFSFSSSASSFSSASSYPFSSFSCSSPSYIFYTAFICPSTTIFHFLSD